MARFLVYDRVVEAALDLPGAMPLPNDATLPDLRIDLGPPAPLPPGAPLYRHDREALVFSPPGVASYRIAETDLSITPCHGADAADVVGLLIATALPAWAWQRGRFVLHASGIVMPGAARAVAIVGLSGSGKSTMLAHLLARHARAVGDDTVAIDGETSAPWASGLAAGYFRRREDGTERDFEPIPAVRSVRGAPLGAIVILAWGDAPPWFERLAPPAAVPLLLANRHRPAVPRLLGREATVLAQCAGLATAVPVYRWHRTAAVPTLSEAEFAALRRMTHD